MGCRQLSDSSPHHNCGTTIDIFFRQAVADSTDLQEKVKAGADLVALGKESGCEFTQEELAAGFVSHRFVNRRYPKPYPRIRKGEGWMCSYLRGLRPLQKGSHFVIVYYDSGTRIQGSWKTKR